MATAKPRKGFKGQKSAVKRALGSGSTSTSSGQPGALKRALARRKPQKFGGTTRQRKY